MEKRNILEDLTSNLQAQTLNDKPKISSGQKRQADVPDLNMSSIHRLKGIPQTESDIQAILSDKRRGPHRKDRKVKKWTPEEDEALRQAVNKHGAKNWKLVATFVPGRDHTQCLQRWSKCLAPGLKKGTWTPEEDALLIQCVHRQLELLAQGDDGRTKIPWGEVCKSIEGRTAKQCRERWVNNLDPVIYKGAWTEEEDAKMRDLYKKYGPSWAAIAKEMTGRTENGVKIRWKALARTHEGMLAAAAAPRIPKGGKRSKSSKTSRKGMTNDDTDEDDEDDDDDDEGEDEDNAEPHVPPMLPTGVSMMLDSKVGGNPGGVYFLPPPTTATGMMPPPSTSFVIPGAPMMSMHGGFQPGMMMPPPAFNSTMSFSSAGQRSDGSSSGRTVEEAMKMMQNSNASMGYPSINSGFGHSSIPARESANRSRSDSGRSGWSESWLGAQGGPKKDDDAASKSSNSSGGSSSAFSGFASASGMSRIGVRSHAASNAGSNPSLPTIASHISGPFSIPGSNPGQQHPVNMPQGSMMSFGSQSGSFGLPPSYPSVFIGPSQGSVMSGSTGPLLFNPPQGIPGQPQMPMMYRGVTSQPSNVEFFPLAMNFAAAANLDKPLQQ